MRLALELARRGVEHVSPNPMVGAVIVRGGLVIGEGYHRRFGGPHAEVEAIRSCLRGGRSPRGADLYVTLEPCGHQGKTPPCSLAIVEAGIARVFFAVRDPNPVTCGVGPRLLRRNGLRVEEGTLGRESAELNAPFFHWIETGMPWIILKWAMTLDGRIAAPGGESRWITGEAARAHAHGLRRRVDAILVGTETALHDDPLLTPRPARGRRPARVVLDRRGRLPLRLRLFSRKESPEEAGRTIYVTSPRISDRRRGAVESRGLQVLVVPERRGRLDLEALFRALGALGISQVLIEGGAQLHGSCLAAGLVHEAAAYVAPRLLGSAGALPPIDGSGLSRLVQTPFLSKPIVKQLGPDVLIQGRLARSPSRPE